MIGISSRVAMPVPESALSPDVAKSGSVCCDVIVTAVEEGVTGSRSAGVTVGLGFDSHGPVARPAKQFSPFPQSAG